MYDVNITKVPRLKVGKGDIEFEIRKGGDRFGTLRVSQGAIVWFPRKTRVNGRKMLWTEFDKKMREQSRKEKRSRSPRVANE